MPLFRFQLSYVVYIYHFDVPIVNIDMFLYSDLLLREQRYLIKIIVERWQNVFLLIILIIIRF